MGNSRKTRNSTETGGASSLHRIMEAARAEFAMHGLEGARIETIARAAEVSPQLIFHYYGSKEGLYSELLVVLADESIQFLRDLDFAAMPPAEALDRLVRGIFHENRKYGATFIADQILHKGAQISSRNPVWKHHSNLLEALENILSRGRAMGVFKPDIGGHDLLLTIVCLSLGQSAEQKRIVGPRISADTVSLDDGWEEFAVTFIQNALRQH